MYCPKCGSQAESGKFCRSCGTNLMLVSSALIDSEQAGGYSVAARGQTTLGIFHSSRLSNSGRSLHGHQTATVFGHIRIDLTAEDLPVGETIIHAFSIFGTIDVLVPGDVGIRITGINVFSTVKVRGEKLDSGISIVNEYVSPGYSEHARRLSIDATSIFSTMKIRR